MTHTWRCKYSNGLIKGLGCLGQSILVIDEFPSSPLPSHLEGEDLILLRSEKVDANVTQLAKVANRTCSKEIF